ncbi:hypothetical protein Bca52824_046002 [Brassica carinata]|uniref:RRM domain-containing protein n=1 Tax=Brassica carinata TaxID=52824 RepID=A0A8X7RGC7_BRACI|nr:hypothetical protein Bca52824_046002 [Brassica carinata]
MIALVLPKQLEILTVLCSFVESFILRRGRLFVSITVLIIHYVVTFCLVTGASRGYAFVEYETEMEMLRAYEDALHSFINGRNII